MGTNPEPEHVITAQQESVDAVVDRIERVYGPYWKEKY